MGKFYNTPKYSSTITAIQLSQLKGAEIINKRNSIKAKVPIRWVDDNKYLYKLEISINQYGSCDVYIIEPKISYETKLPPHIYSRASVRDEENKVFIKLKLCLFYPGSGEYTWKDNIVTTIVSWAIKWTEFYELWLLTGDWYGGGKHPSSGEKENTDEKQ